jgi:hypothetical protein
MSLKLTKHQLELFKFPDGKISKNQHIIDGVKKNATQAIILSEGKNTDTGIPFLDLRMWVMNSDTEKWVPTPKGLRLSPVQYQALFNMLKDHEDFLLIGENNKGKDGYGMVLGYLQDMDLKATAKLVYENN